MDCILILKIFAMSLLSFIDKLAIFNLLRNLFSKKTRQPLPNSNIPYDYDIEPFITDHLDRLQNQIDSSKKEIASLQKKSRDPEQFNAEYFDPDELDDRMDMLEDELDNLDPDSDEYAELLNEITDIQDKLDNYHEAEDEDFNRFMNDFDNDTYFDDDVDFESDYGDDRWD